MPQTSGISASQKASRSKRVASMTSSMVANGDGSPPAVVVPVVSMVRRQISMISCDSGSVPRSGVVVE
jgi:hypothetical protein